MEPKFLLYSHKWTRGSAIWWRANSNGYTTDLNQAGRYNALVAKEIQDSSGGETYAIEESIALSLPFAHTIDVSVIRAKIRETETLPTPTVQNLIDQLSPNSQLTK